MKQLKTDPSISYADVKKLAIELARRANLINAMTVKLVSENGSPRFNFSDREAALDLPDLTGVNERLAELEAQIGETSDTLVQSETENQTLQIQIDDLQDDVDAANNVLSDTGIVDYANISWTFLYTNQLLDDIQSTCSFSLYSTTDDPNDLTIALSTTAPSGVPADSDAISVWHKVPPATGFTQTTLPFSGTRISVGGMSIGESIEFEVSNQGQGAGSVRQRVSAGTWTKVTSDAHGGTYNLVSPGVLDGRV